MDFGQRLRGILEYVDSVNRADVVEKAKTILLHSDKVSLDFLRDMISEFIEYAIPGSQKLSLELFLTTISIAFLTGNNIAYNYFDDPPTRYYKSLDIYMLGLTRLYRYYIDYNDENSEDFSIYLKSYKKLVLLTDLPVRNIIPTGIAILLWQQDVMDKINGTSEPVVVSSLYYFLLDVIHVYGYFKGMSSDEIYDILSVIPKHKLEDPGFNLLTGYNIQTNYVIQPVIYLENAYEYAYNLMDVSSRLGIPQRNHFFDRIIIVDEIARYPLNFEKLNNKDTQYESIMIVVSEWMYDYKSKFMVYDVLDDDDESLIAFYVVNEKQIFAMIYYVCRFNLINNKEKEFILYRTFLEQSCLEIIKAYMLMMNRDIQLMSETFKLLMSRQVLNQNNVHELSGNDFVGPLVFASPIRIETLYDKKLNEFSESAQISYYAYLVELLYDFIQLERKGYKEWLVKEFLDNFTESVNYIDVSERKLYSIDLDARPNTFSAEEV